MIAGKLRHSVQLIRDVVTGTGNRGQAETTPITLATVPAAIEELSGTELEKAKQLVATATTRVTIRYYEGLTTADRVQFGDRVLNIGHILNFDNRNFSLVLTCSEVK